VSESVDIAFSADFQLGSIIAAEPVDSTRIDIPYARCRVARSYQHFARARGTHVVDTTLLEDLGAIHAILRVVVMVVVRRHHENDYVCLSSFRRMDGPDNWPRRTEFRVAEFDWRAGAGDNIAQMHEIQSA
jgi:hypothetical protein